MSTDTGRQEQTRKWGQIVAKAWADDGFKQRLVAEPGAVLSEQGVQLPSGLEVRVMESTANVLYLALPPKPAEGELSEEQLEGASGGTGFEMSFCMTCV